MERDIRVAPGGSAVDTHWKIIFALARFESSRVVVGRHVPLAAHHYKYVLSGGVDAQK